MEEEKLQDLEMSKSRKFIEVVNRVLDWIMWGIIAVFVYIWWNTRAKSVDCTYDVCKMLYENVSGLI